jgi:hypothetical protein
MNVSREADAAFLADLKRTDRARYERLLNLMQRDHYRLNRESQPEAA